MELTTKNIHMDRIKCEMQAQVALEDDINIADVKPDVFALVTEKGEVEIEEIRAAEDHVTVKGKLRFCILYLSDEDVHHPAGMEGNLGFEEKLFLKGVLPSDAVTVHADLEDLSVGMINSRKLSVQALMRVSAQAEKQEDILPAVDADADFPVEIQKKTLQTLHLAIRKKDIFRVKKEVELPGGMPNIFQILWQSCRLRDLSFVPGSQSLRLQGELELFILYEGEGENRPAMWYETVLPVMGDVECQGMHAEMLEDISCRIGHKEIEVKSDDDGEERRIALDLVLDLDMKLYEELEMEMLSDIYGVTKNVEAVCRNGEFKHLLAKNNGKARVTGKMQISPGMPLIRKICHTFGEVLLDEVQQVAEGLRVNGTLEVRMLYAAQDAEQPFCGMKSSLPFSYVLETGEKEQEDLVWRLEPALEFVQTTLAGEKEAEVKAQISLKSFICRWQEEALVADIKVSEPDPARLNALPGIVAYIVREGDGLWNIGKRYGVPVRNLKEMNDLAGDEIKAGDKLLIVKGG